MKKNAIILLFNTLLLVLLSTFASAKEVVTHYKSGKIEEIYQTDENDEKHGLYQLFDEQGNITSTGYYQHGKQNGFWKVMVFEQRRKMFSENKEKEVFSHDMGYYKNGVAIGVWKRQLSDGHIAITRYNDDGEPHGVAYLVNKYGALVYLSYAIDGNNYELCSDDYIHRLSPGC